MGEEFPDDMLETKDSNITENASSVFVIKPKKRKSKYRFRKVLHVWTDEEISNLIAAVQKRRGIWDASSPEYRYRLGRKQNDWRAVVNELGNDIKVDDAKAKWMNLRVTFKTNLSKMRSMKSGQTANNSVKVHWRYFNALMFLKANEVTISNKTALSMPPSSATTNKSILNDLDVPKLATTTTCQCKKRSRAPSIPTPPSSLASSSSINFKEIAAIALQSLKPIDQHTVFGEYIASELRALPQTESDALRLQIARLICNFMENR